MNHPWTLTAGTAKRHTRHDSRPTAVTSTLALIVSLLAVVLIPLHISPALAAAPPSASCTGQFFSSHAGLAAQHIEPRNVGEFVAATAQELGDGFGGAISSARDLPREGCGL
jgi:hypothetical protein